MTTIWTEEQNKAISTKGKSLLVSAGAGSGKTAVLVERIIKIIIHDKVDIRRLLVVTFTKAAAEEMRIRIYKGLNKALTDTSFDNEQEFLREQLNYISIASISTFHSFCMSIVKKYYHIIDLDPTIKIGDDVHLSVLRSKAMDTMMEESYEKGEEDFIALLDAYNNKRGDGNFRNIIERIYNITMNRPNPREWSESLLDGFHMTMEQFNESKYYWELKTHLSMRLKAALYQFNIAWEIAYKNLDNDKNIDLLFNETNQTKNLIDSLDKGYECFFNNLNGISFKTLRIKCENIEIKESIQYHRNKGKDIIKKINSIIEFNQPHNILDQLKETEPLMRYMMSMVFRFKDIFENIKLDKGIIDFNDLEHYCIKIFMNEEVNKELQDYYEYIFVDEYQDSNEIQDKIISSIMRKNNVFFVGDVKQSIYRFRMSDPTMFLQKQKEFISSDENIIGEIINLNMNFRSSDKIIKGINYIFEKIMNPYIGEVLYDDKSKLYSGMDCSEITDDNVEITVIDNDLEENTAGDSTDYMEVEAHILADKILQLVGETVYDPTLNLRRPIIYGDMVVLLRTTKVWSEVYYTVFKSRGIPVHTETQTEFLESMEISLIMQLLKVIDNRYQDIPLVSLMGSPFFSFTPDEMAMVVVNKNKMNIYEQIKIYILENNNELSGKLKDMMEKINRWRSLSRFVSLYDLIWMIVEESGYYHFISAMPGGEQRITNMRILMDKAREYSESNINGLFNFIQLIEGIHMTKKDLASNRSTGTVDNALRIMSIHKSKGLEFPVVFIGGMGKKFNFQDTRESIIVHKDLGICPNYVNLHNRTYCPTIFKSIAKEKINIETLSEEMRVLYVALTRAKQKLYMIGTVKNLQKKLEEVWTSNMDEYTIATANNYLDWIMPTVILQENEFINLNVAKMSEIEEHREKEKISQINKIDNLREMVLKNSEVSESIKEKLEWVYPESQDVNIPSKISLSEYINMSGEKAYIHRGITDVSKVPKFIDDKKKSGIQKGTNIHFIMQHLDLDGIRSGYSKLESEIEKQIMQMIEKQIIKKDDIEKYFIEKISKFFKSDLGKKMLMSRKIYREKPFNLEKHIFEEKHNVLMQGVIDCFFYEVDGYILLDYKSDYYSDKDEENKIIKKYTGQVLLYKEAVEKLTKVKVKNSYIYLFHEGKYREIEE